MKTVTLLCLVAALSSVAEARPTIVELMSDISLSNEELNLALQNEAKFLFMRGELPQGSEDMIALLSKYADQEDFGLDIWSEEVAVVEVGNHLDELEQQEKVHIYIGQSKEQLLHRLGKNLASFCLSEARAGKKATCGEVKLQERWIRVVESVYSQLERVLKSIYEVSIKVANKVKMMERLLNAYMKSGFSPFYIHCYGKLFVEGLKIELEDFNVILQRMAKLASADVLRHQTYPQKKRKNSVSIGFISALSEFLKSNESINFSPAWKVFGSVLFQHFVKEVSNFWSPEIARNVLRFDAHSLVVATHHVAQSSKLLSSYLEEKWRKENWSFANFNENEGTEATKVFLLQVIRHTFGKNSKLVTLEELQHLAECAHIMFPVDKADIQASTFLSVPRFFSIGAELGSSGVKYEPFDAAYVLFIMSIAKNKNIKADINAEFPNFLNINREVVYTLHGIDYSVRDHSALTHLILARLTGDKDSFYLPKLDETYFTLAAKWLENNSSDALSIFARDFFVHRFKIEPQNKTELLTKLFDGYKFTGNDIRSFQILFTNTNQQVL